MNNQQLAQGTIASAIKKRVRRKSLMTRINGLRRLFL
jgi:hypothetical protein